MICLLFPAFFKMCHETFSVSLFFIRIFQIFGFFASAEAGAARGGPLPFLPIGEGRKQQVLCRKVHKKGRKQQEKGNSDQ